MISRFRLALVGRTIQSVRRSVDTLSTLVEDMSIEYRRATVLVAQEFLCDMDGKVKKGATARI